MFVNCKFRVLHKIVPLQSLCMLCSFFAPFCSYLHSCCELLSVDLPSNCNPVVATFRAKTRKGLNTYQQAR